VEVDNAAPLVFGDLGVGDPDLGGKRRVGQPCLSGEGTAQGDGKAAPEFGGAGVEENGAGVVVAIRAQRLAEPGVVAGMLLRAGQAVAMWTGPAASPGPASHESAVFLPVGVDRAE
jgi:hypothetical protein